MKSATRSHGVPSEQRARTTGASRSRPSGSSRQREAPRRRQAPATRGEAATRTAPGEAHTAAGVGPIQDARPHRGSAPPYGQGRPGPDPSRGPSEAFARPHVGGRCRSSGPVRPRRRLIAAVVVIGAILLGLIGRVADLQTTEAENLRSAAADQWTRSVSIPAQRGTVFDRHGAELSMSVPAVTVSINPKLIENGTRDGPDPR